MPLTLREKILRNIAGLDDAGEPSSPVAGLRSITVSNGYNQTIERTYLIGVSSMQMTVFPAINVIERGDAVKRLLQKIDEHLMTVELECFINESIDQQRTLELERFMADVAGFVEDDDNQTWGELAIRTSVVRVGSSPFELQEPFSINRVTMEVLYRTERGNPFVQAIL